MVSNSKFHVGRVITNLDSGSLTVKRCAYVLVVRVPTLYRSCVLCGVVRVKVQTLTRAFFWLIRFPITNFAIGIVATKTSSRISFKFNWKRWIIDLDSRHINGMATRPFTQLDHGIDLSNLSENVTIEKNRKFRWWFWPLLTRHWYCDKNTYIGIFERLFSVKNAEILYS